MKNKEEQTAPKLRFKGYTDAWQQGKLADRLKIHSGKDYKELNIGKIPVYGTGGYMLSVDKSLSEKDAIGIGRKGTINKPQLLHAPFWTVDTLFYLTPKANNNLNFLFYLFQNINWNKYDESTGLPSLSKKTINNIKENTPSKSEQKKIGRLLLKLDNIVTLLQQKIKLLEQFRSTYVETTIEYLSRKNNYKKLEKYLSVPSLEQVKVSNLNELLSVKLNTQGITKGASRSTLNLGSTKYFKRHAGQLIYGKQNFFNGAIALIPTHFDGLASSGDVPALNIDSKVINPNYLYLYLSRPNFYKNTEKLTTGTGSKRLHIADLLNISISCPPLEKQQEIVNIVKEIDKSITNYHTQLMKYSLFKRFLLQNMFI